MNSVGVNYGFVQNRQSFKSLQPSTSKDIKEMTLAELDITAKGQDRMYFSGNFTESLADQLIGKNSVYNRADKFTYRKNESGTKDLFAVKKDSNKLHVKKFFSGGKAEEITYTQDRGAAYPKEATIKQPNGEVFKVSFNPKNGEATKVEQKVNYGYKQILPVPDKAEIEPQKTKTKQSSKEAWILEDLKSKSDSVTEKLQDLKPKVRVKTSKGRTYMYLSIGDKEFRSRDGKSFQQKGVKGFRFSLEDIQRQEEIGTENYIKETKLEKTLAKLKSELPVGSGVIMRHYNSKNLNENGEMRPAKLGITAKRNGVKTFLISDDGKNFYLSDKTKERLAKLENESKDELVKVLASISKDATKAGIDVDFNINRQGLSNDLYAKYSNEVDDLIENPENEDIPVLKEQIASISNSEIKPLYIDLGAGKKQSFVTKDPELQGKINNVIEYYNDNKSEIGSIEDLYKGLDPSNPLEAMAKLSELPNIDDYLVQDLLSIFTNKENISSLQVINYAGEGISDVNIAKDPISTLMQGSTKFNTQQYTIPTEKLESAGV